MPRAGEARISYNSSALNGQSASRYRMLFQTVGIFESVFKMRDTLDCYYSTDNILLFSTKHINEGGYYLIDDLTFSYTGQQTSVHSHRYTPTETKVDTNLTVTSGHVFDMLGATFFLRTLDTRNLKPGDNFPCTVAIGRDLVQVIFRYQNQAIIERNQAKYRTHYFIIDIHDDAFSQSKASAEIWVGDDENNIPIKIRTKLKVGYAEVYYKNSSNLKKPLDCRVELKKQ